MIISGAQMVHVCQSPLFVTISQTAVIALTKQHAECPCLFKLTSDLMVHCG